MILKINGTMGIKLLNKHLKRQWNSYANQSNFNELRNKKICIDIYNYIYTFLGNNKLIEELSALCYNFQKNRVHAIFVFDGKYIEEKKDEYERRHKNRILADKKYKRLVKKSTTTKIESSKLKKKLRELNRDRVRVTKWDIYDAKKCLEHCGMTYIVANGEAEELCAELVNKNKVYACMSEDTDLFAYGCKKIMKCVNIFTGNFIMYNMDAILHYYDMTYDSFKLICTMSSNDYSHYKKKHFIYYYTLYKKYMEEKKIMENNIYNSNTDTFIEWMLSRSFINNNDIIEYEKNTDIFDLIKKNIMSQYKYIIIRNRPYNKSKVNQLKIDRRLYLSGEK